MVFLILCGYIKNCSLNNPGKGLQLSVRFEMANQVMAFDEAQNAEKNLNWCLRPIVFWMKIIGIHLHNNCSQESSFRNYITIVFCNIHSYGLCLANIVLNTVYLINSLYKRNSSTNATNSSKANTLFWNACIDDINYCFHSISVHLITFFVVSSWNKIIHSLKATENFLPQIYQINYSKLNKLCAAGVFYIIISVRNVF
jgi:hypothetical protein